MITRRDVLSCITQSLPPVLTSYHAAPHISPCIHHNIVRTIISKIYSSKYVFTILHILNLCIIVSHAKENISVNHPQTTQHLLSGIFSRTTIFLRDSSTIKTYQRRRKVVLKQSTRISLLTQ